MKTIEELKSLDATISHGKIKYGKDFYKIEYHTDKGLLKQIKITKKQFKELLPFIKLDMTDLWGEDILYIYSMKY